MKRWLAYFFLLIFSFQALPVKAIGKILAKQQLTEEVKNDCDGDDDGADDSDDLEPLKEAYPHNFNYSERTARAFAPGVYLYRHGKEDLPNSHVKDIHCPPPNC